MTTTEQYLNPEPFTESGLLSRLIEEATNGGPEVEADMAFDALAFAAGSFCRNSAGFDSEDEARMVFLTAAKFMFETMAQIRRDAEDGDELADDPYDFEGYDSEGYYGPPEGWYDERD